MSVRTFYNLLEHIQTVVCTGGRRLLVTAGGLRHKQGRGSGRGTPTPEPLQRKQVARELAGCHRGRFLNSAYHALIELARIRTMDEKSLRCVPCSLVYGTKESAGSRTFGGVHCSNRAAADLGRKVTRARELGATEERYLRRDRRSAKSGGIASSGSGGTSGTLSRTRLRCSGVGLPARR